MPSNHLIFCRPLLLLPSIFPSIRVFPSELVLHIRWPNYWSFSFTISPSSEYSGLTSFRIDWLDLLVVQGTLKSIQHYSSKALFLFIYLFFNSKTEFIYLFIFPPFIFISWRLVTLQYCSGFCCTLTWISNGFTCVPCPDLPSCLPLHPIPLGHDCSLETYLELWRKKSIPEHLYFSKSFKITLICIRNLKSDYRFFC